MPILEGRKGKKGEDVSKPCEIQNSYAWRKLKSRLLLLSFGGRWDGRGTGHESNFGNDAFATEQDKSGAGRDARRRRGREKRRDAKEARKRRAVNRGGSIISIT